MTLIEANKIGAIASQSITIAIIGDVHDQWSPADAQALAALDVDLALFVGDFGNEAIAIVRQIAALSVPKAVILGNHDAWYTASQRNRKKCPYDPTKEDRVQQQLDALGRCHVGFGKLELPQWNITVIGARPFSWGGANWRYKQFYKERYGVSSFAESTARICAMIDRADHDTLIFLGHNGPAGLGNQTHNICGRDWKRKGGDYGDPDFADAIASAHQSNRQVALVAFGHMHHELRHDKTRLRERLVVDDYGTVYANGAQVPRVVETDSGWRYSFTLVTLQSGIVQTVRLIWVNSLNKIVSEDYLYPSPQKVNVPLDAMVNLG